MKRSRSVHSRRRLAGASAVLLVAVAVGVLALAGSASSRSATLGVGRSVQVGSQTESIAVTSTGAPVYRLAPETAKHLLCTSRACLSFWPPVKLAKGAKPTKGAGITGRLGTLKRTGFTQLTLNGHPLYTFSEDKGKKGEAHGDGLKTFGGTWHVFKQAGTSTVQPPASTSSTSSTSTPTSTTTTTTTTSTSPYGY